MLWGILIILAVLFVFAIAVGVMQGNETAEKVSALEKSLRDEFDIDELFVSSVDQSFVGFSFNRNMIIVGDPAFRKEYMLSEVASVEVIQNGASVTSTNRGSQALGAAVGGIAFGGVGLLAGALTGSKRTVDRVSELAIKITIDDRVRPLHFLRLFKWHDKKGVEADNFCLKPWIETADRINAHFVIGMRKATESTAQLAAPAAKRLASPMSYAEQIKQLWDLHQAGALSADEFERQKTVLAPLAAGPAT
jgi:hypothetical protein